MLNHLIMTIIIASSVSYVQEKIKLSSLVSLFMSVAVAYLLLSVALFVSVGIWSLLYYKMNLISSLDDAFYTALVNYTTLGLGDLRQSAQTRLFGPMAAASGIMMFGWAAAVMVYILQLHLSDMLIRKKR